MPYAATPTTTINFEALYDAIEKAAGRGVNRTGVKALRIARHKAPVRKVFSGGRQTLRPLSAKEVRGAQVAFRAAFPQTKAFDLWEERGGNKAVQFRNQANTVYGRSSKRTNTLAARQVVEDPYGHHLKNPYYARSLSARGRYELKTARAVFEPQEQTREERADFAAAGRQSGREGGQFERLSVVEQPKLQLGGALRDSIELVDDSEGEMVKVSVTAGNERVHYAKYVEFGTRHAPAQPFLRPAIKEVRGDLGPNVRAALASLRG